MLNQELLNRLEVEIPQLLSDDKVKSKTIEVAKALKDYFSRDVYLCETAKKFKINKGTLLRCLNAYKKKGIDGLKEQDLRINYKTLDKEKKKKLCDSLRADISKLDSEKGNAKIIEILKAFLVLFTEKKSTKEVAELFNICKRKFYKYLKIYREKGIEELKNTINGTIAIDNEQKLYDYLERVEIPKLKLEGVNPKFIEIAKALMVYLTGESSIDDIAKKYRIPQAEFSQYLKTYREKGIEELKNKIIRTIDIESKQDFSDFLEMVEIPKLELEGVNPKFIEIAKALMVYLNGERSKDDIVKYFKISESKFSQYLEIYTEKGMEKLENKIIRTIDIESKQGFSDFLEMVEMPKLEFEGVNSRIIEIAKALMIYFNGEGSKKEIAKYFKISKSIFFQYLKTYIKYGMEKLKNKIDNTVDIESEQRKEKSILAVGGKPTNYDRKRRFSVSVSRGENNDFENKRSKRI